MRIYFKGPYIDDNRLPHEEIAKHPDATKFKEFENTHAFLLGINLLSFLLLGMFALIYHKISGLHNISITGVAMVMLAIIPHEYIHASWFKRKAYVYTHKYAVMITGTEPMSKKRFILMCLTPSIFFGFMPFLAYLIHPEYRVLGTLGGITLPMCLGDFYNIYNCYKQVPDDGYCFMSKQNTYWFIPEKARLTRRLRPTIIDRLYAFVSIVTIAFIWICGLYGQECLGLALQAIIYEWAAYSFIAYMQIQDY